MTVKSNMNNAILFCNDVRDVSNHITFYKNGTPLTLERHYLFDDWESRSGYVIIGQLSKDDVIKIERTGSLATAGTCYAFLFDAEKIEYYSLD